MIVVSNTSPLTNLATIQQFRLLRALYGHLHIANGVWDELNAYGKHWPGRDEVAAADWITWHTVQNTSLVTTLQNDLHRGESETIALAIELNADLVLIDEKSGRRIAKRHELAIAGVLGVLLQAKSAALLSTIRPQLNALRQEAGFYISDSLYEQVLLQVDE